MVKLMPKMSLKFLAMDPGQMLYGFAKLRFESKALMESIAKTKPQQVLQSSSDWAVCIRVRSFKELDKEGQFSAYQNLLEKEMKKRKLTPTHIEAAWQLRPKDFLESVNQ
eukprot:TRINITY_DN6069_c0_g1_i6.p1 TRINITY_DN6069_c0_g1~~TRINITY_DN6069_c0_g1_i6.p1  ORF type:complete len:110 (-),score=25.67 TRINITY_DN6069_c0_g1_i6:99-428(-)